MTDNDTAVQLPGAIATRNLSVDEDDVDLFVSPRRFGGATPSAKAARDRAFQIHLQGSNSQLDPVVPVAENAGVRKDDSSYSIGTNLDGKFRLLSTYGFFLLHSNVITARNNGDVLASLSFLLSYVLLQMPKVSIFPKLLSKRYQRAEEFDGFTLRLFA